MDEHRHGTHGPDGIVDVVIVGGGAAGLSAALALGRVRRSVVVIDAGEPRNAPAAHMHGFLSRDGMPPKEFLAVGREEVRDYDVAVLDGRAVSAEAHAGTFVVSLEDGRRVAGRRMLVTTGLIDELPEIDGLAERWGDDVVHCPFCHGWEVRDRPLAVIGVAGFGPLRAQMFRNLSDDVTLVVHDGVAPSEDEQARLATLGVAIVDGPALEVVVADDHVTGLRLANGEVLPAAAIVAGGQMVARSTVLQSLGLEPVDHPMGMGASFEADGDGRTTVPGLWVAGNVTDIRASVVHAAAGGFTAAVAINADLLATDVERAATTSHVHDLPPVMDQAFWDGWYAQTDQVWSGDPNPWLVAEAGGLTPGRALDVGAGEGADALWLAEQGWEVTAVDIAALALDRGRAEATRRGGDVAGRIDWHPADVTTWAPPAGAFDLVTLQFVHLTAAERAVAYPACAAAVARARHAARRGPRPLRPRHHRRPLGSSRSLLHRRGARP